MSCSSEKLSKGTPTDSHQLKQTLLCMPAVLRSRGDGAAGRHLEIPPVCSNTHSEEQEGHAAYSALLTFDFQAVQPGKIFNPVFRKKPGSMLSLCFNYSLICGLFKAGGLSCISPPSAENLDPLCFGCICAISPSKCRWKGICQTHIPSSALQRGVFILPVHSSTWTSTTALHLCHLP